MDKIQKFVRKLSQREADRILDVIARVRAGRLGELDVKKLKGEEATYRVRIGKVRIKFIKMLHGNVVSDIDFRNDNTY